MRDVIVLMCGSTCSVHWPYAVPGAKVRALLADLVAHRGDLIPAARPMDDLWGTALQVKVSQLREALDDADPGTRTLVVSRPPGYLLDVPPG